MSFNVNDHVMVHYHVPKKGLRLKLLLNWIESLNKNRIMAVHVQRMRKYKPWLDKES